MSVWVYDRTPVNTFCQYVALLLIQGQEKMSKSDPNSAIFMEDSAAEVRTKIKKAFCPPEQASHEMQCARCSSLSPGTIA